MGEQMGSLYSELWQELARVYETWAEYVVLFGTKESRVSLMNSVAPAFTRMVQDSLWEGVILHVARMTDPPKSLGKPNLSVCALQQAVVDDVLKARVIVSVDEAVHAADFCRDWRNRRLAHRDLQLVLGAGAEPLKAGSRLKVQEALTALSRVLNLLSQHYFESTTMFDFALQSGDRPGGAMSLLCCIDKGKKLERLKLERIKNGHFNPNDFQSPDL